MTQISRPELADAVAMHDLQQRAFAEEGRRSGTREIPPLMETPEAIAVHIDTQTALVAKDGATIIGSIRGVVKDGVCTIRALVVDPAYQGRGLGTSLLRALEAALPAIRRFELTTNMLMQDNVPFYERHGYVVYETIQHNDIIKLAQMAKDRPASDLTADCRKDTPMPDNRSMPAARVIPELAYADVPQAAQWLCAAFGFSVRLRIGEHRVQLVFEGGAVIVRGGKAAPADDASHSVMVRVDDVDAHYGRAIAMGATTGGAPTTFPYGERQYSAQDIGGHWWTFSQSVADVHPAEWGGTLVED